MAIAMATQASPSKFMVDVEAPPRTGAAVTCTVGATEMGSDEMSGNRLTTEDKIAVSGTNDIRFSAMVGIPVTYQRVDNCCPDLVRLLRELRSLSQSSLKMHTSKTCKSEDRSSHLSANEPFLS
jgi:hypothetical protein